MFPPRFHPSEGSTEWKGEIPIGKGLVFRADAKGFQEGSILVCEPSLKSLFGVGGDLFPVDDAGGLAPLVESDGEFENQDKVVAGITNLGQDLGDLVGFGERIVDDHTQLADEAFEFRVLRQTQSFQSSAAAFRGVTGNVPTTRTYFIAPLVGCQGAAEGLFFNSTIDVNAKLC